MPFQSIEHLDLRTNQSELTQLESHIFDAGLEPEWSDWCEIFQPERAPQALGDLASNGKNPFAHVDRWFSTRHIQLCELITDSINRHKLITLATPIRASVQGTAVGGQFSENPLRGAFAVHKQPALAPILDPLLALLFSYHTNAGVSPPNAWRDVICRAAHNQTADWNLFLTQFRPPKSSSLMAVVEWGAKLAPEEGRVAHIPRDTDRKFLSATRKLCEYFSGDLFASSRVVTRRVVCGPNRNDDQPQPEIERHTLDSVLDVDANTFSQADAPDHLVVVRVDTPKSEPEATFENQEMRQARGAFRSAIANQRLRFHWDALLPDEASVLIQSAERDLTQSDRHIALGALVNLLGLCLGLNPDKIWSLRIGDDINPGFDIDRGVFVKRVPRPFASWTPSKKYPGKVLPSAEVLNWPLPKSVVTALSHLIVRKSVGLTLADSFATEEGDRQSIVSDWLKSARLGIHRLTGARIERFLEVEVFARSQRAVMTHLAAGDDNDPAPSGNYYTAFLAADVLRTYVDTINSIWARANSDAQLGKFNVSATEYAGTRLLPTIKDVRPLEKFLRTQQIPLDRLGRLDKWRDHHNRFVAYVAHLLFFATGHRPVSDPFDSLPSVAPDLDWALIQDKVEGAARAVRLVPLCPMACAQLHAYLAHLEALRDILPERFKLREALESQLAHRDRVILPLFFFIDDKNEWQSVTESSMQQFLPEEWGYPANMPRHFLSTWLHAKGIHEEAISSFLGHIDVGTASLSLISPHSPMSLFAPVRESIETLLNECGWRVLQGLPPSIGLPIRKQDVPILEPQRPFGAQQREIERKRLEDLDIKSVGEKIDQQLAGRHESQIDQSDVDALFAAINQKAPNKTARRALLRQDGLFRRLLAIRKEHNCTFRLPNRRWLIAHEDSLATQATLVNARKAQQLRQRFLTHLEKMQGALQPGNYPNHRAAHALFALIALARVLDVAVLRKVLEGVPYWLIEHDSLGLLIEIQVSPVNIRRYPVGTLGAALLSSPCFSKASAVKVEQEFIRLIWRLDDEHSQSKRDLLPSVVAAFLDEARLELPGDLVGFLSGEMGSASLPRQPWLRLVTGEAPIPDQLPKLDTWDASKNDELEDEAATEDVDGHQFADIGEISPVPFDVDARRLAQEFVKAVDAEMSRLWDPAGEAGSIQSAKANAALQPLADFVEQLIAERQSRQALPAICYLLGAWLTRLCRKGSKRGKVRASTVRTYWSTLKDPLIEFAPNVGLTDLEAPALEEIYSRVLEQTKFERPHLVLRRLTLFHSFLQKEFGVAHVDWSEVIPEAFPAHELAIDAGIILPSEYYQALELLFNDSHTLELRDRLLNCVCLILTGRYGLRISEATGIRRKDLLGEIRNLIVRVCNDDFRKVKTDAAVRHVPSLGEFSQLEHSILESWLEHVDWLHSDDRLSGLFAAEKSGRILVDQWRVASRVTEALVAVTGNKATRIHHGRHTFASQLHMTMTSNDSEKNGSKVREFFTFVDRTTRQTLLQRTQTSRRGMWAVASILGHAHPRTTLRHYCHCQDLLLATREDAVINPDVSPKQFENAMGRDAKTYQRKLGDQRDSLSEREQAVILGGVERVRDLVKPRDGAVMPSPRRPTISTTKSDLEIVLRVLHAATPATRVQNIANRILVAPEQIGKVLDAAADISDVTGYGEPLPLPDPFDLSITEWKRILELTSSSKLQFEKQASIFLEMGEIWARGFAPSSRLVLIAELDELTVIEAFFKSIDLPQSQWKLHVDRATTDEHWCQPFIDRALQIGVQIVESDRLPLLLHARRLRRTQRERVGVSVSEARAGALRNMKVASRFFYSIATVGRFHEKRNVDT